jgi:hypothetical protein
VTAAGSSYTMPNDWERADERLAALGESYATRRAQTLW